MYCYSKAFQKLEFLLPNDVFVFSSEYLNNKLYAYNFCL